MEHSSELLNQTSIIVCTVDRLVDLDACLKSLSPFQSVVAGIVVVNNGSRGAEVKEIARRNGASTVHEPRCGVSSARNAGIRAATGSILAFLDDDSVADANWLPTLIAPLRDRRIFAVAGSIRSQTLEDPISQAFDALHRAQFPESPIVFDASAEPGRFPLRAALVGNANMAIRREAFVRFGYFDPRFGRGTRIGSGEEPDLLLRILLGGGKIAVEPSAFILHRHATDWKSVRHWAFASGCAHTALLTKYFLREPLRRGQVLRYAATRLGRQQARTTPGSASFGPPKVPFLLGSLCGPMAYLLSGNA